MCAMNIFSHFFFAAWADRTAEGEHFQKRRAHWPTCWQHRLCLKAVKLGLGWYLPLALFFFNIRFFSKFSTIILENIVDANSFFFPTSKSFFPYIEELFSLHRRAFFPTYIQLYTGCMQLNKYWKLDWVISRFISILGFWILQHSHALHEHVRLAEKFLKLAQAVECMALFLIFFSVGRSCC